MYLIRVLNKGRTPANLMLETSFGPVEKVTIGSFLAECSRRPVRLGIWPAELKLIENPA